MYVFVFILYYITGFWYRGVVLDIEGTDYTILMVDFGNETTVQSDKIRKFPAEMQKIPMLGLTCDFKSKKSFQNINKKAYVMI